MPSNAVQVSYNKFFAITKSDTVDFPEGNRPDAIFVGAPGDVVVALPDNTLVTLVGITANTVLPISCRRVHSTGTTAASMVGLKQV